MLLSDDNGHIGAAVAAMGSEVFSILMVHTAGKVQFGSAPRGFGSPSFKGSVIKRSLKISCPAKGKKS